MMSLKRLPGAFQFSALGAGSVALGSGLMGALMGAGTGIYQMAVESAQVQAGLVSYPPDNSFYLYHLKIWTLTVQLPALALALGASEPVVNLVLTTLMGALSFMPLALCTYVLCRRPWISMAIPALVEVSELYEAGTTYFIAMLANPHTFGIVGTAWCLLTLVVAGLERWSLFGFMLALAPAVHPGTGPWVWGVVALASLWDHRSLRSRIRKVAPAFAAGLALTIFSFAFHLSLAKQIPPIHPDEARRYLDAFVKHWDDHRKPVKLISLGMVLGVETLLVCGLWLRQRGESLAEGTRFMLHAFFVSAACALAASVLSHYQPWLPGLFSSAMPWRNLNVTGLAFTSLTVGLLLSIRPTRSADSLGTLSLLGLSSRVLLPALPARGVLPLLGLLVSVLSRRGSVRKWTLGSPIQLAAYALLALSGLAMLLVLEPGTLQTLKEFHPSLAQGIELAAPVLGTYLLSLALLGLLAVGLRRARRGRGTSASARARLSLLARASLLTLMLLVVLTEGLQGWENGTGLADRLRDWRSDPLLARVSRTEGLLLVGSNMGQLQLFTRRPVLLNGYNLNSLPYVLESGPSMARVLSDVYGIDLFHPGVQRFGGLSQQDGRTLWQERTPEQWRPVLQRHGVGAIITPATWSLQLPLVDRNRNYALYGMPTESAPP